MSPCTFPRCNSLCTHKYIHLSNLYFLLFFLQIGRPLYTQESISPVDGEPARQRSQSVLLVDEVRDVDQGTYTCTAQNLQGAKSVSTNVKVLPKSKLKKPSSVRQ